MRSLVLVLLLGLLGVGSLVTGVSGYLDTEVRCGGRVMSPADTCRTYGTSPRVYDFEGKQAAEAVESGIGVGLGVLLLLLPVAAVVRWCAQRGRPGPARRGPVPARVEEWARRTAGPPPYR